MKNKTICRCGKPKSETARRCRDCFESGSRKQLSRVIRYKRNKN